MAETLPDSDLVTAILHQARSGLAALVERDSASVVDLATLNATEIAALDAALGRGEVAARVVACGEVSLYETGFAGVWRIDHLGPDAATARFIEITLAPTLLCTPREDAAAGLALLERRLDGG